MMMMRLLLLLCLLHCYLIVGLTAQRHSSNHALIVSSSRYWFNYRHANNALAIYQLLRNNGVPPENIVLMVADDYPTNPRNPFKNKMTINGVDSLYDANTIIDYRGNDVTVQNVIKVLLGLGDERVLSTNQESNLMIYWTGHGGDGFFKFQDYEEITSKDIARLLHQMKDLEKYNEVLFLADTCQAFTLFKDLDENVHSNIYAIGSSLKDENSYAHHVDRSLGLSVIERYTHFLVQHLHKNVKGKLHTTMVETMNRQYGHLLKSTVGYRQVNVTRDGSRVPLLDFMGHSPRPERGQLWNEIVSQEDATLWTTKAVPKEEQATIIQDEEICEAKTESCQQELFSLSNDTEVHSYKGMEPTDLTFIMIVGLFFSLVLLSKHF